MAISKKTVKNAKPAVEIQTVDQLRADLLAKQTDLIAAKRGHKMGEITNPSVLRATRKQIARLHTAIRASVISSEGKK